MLAAFDAPGYLLKVRGLFIFVSALGVLWVYGAARDLRLKWWIALVAASGLGLSWEYAYHARFAVTDCIMVQFTALTMFMLARFLRTRNVRWLYAASVAVGLATGTKYTGVFLLLPVALARMSTVPPPRLFPAARQVVLLFGLAFATYLVTTPATLLNPFAFFSDLRWISKAYAGSHGGYTADNGWEHAKIAFSFLSLSYFSPYRLLAVTFFVGALVGAVLWFRRDRRVAAVLLSVPVVFLTLFCAKYHIVTVRNYLFLAPALSLLLAQTFAELDRRISKRIVRWLLASGLSAALLAQAIWLVRAGESIRNVDPKLYVRESVAYVANHPKTRFLLSKNVRALAEEQHLDIPPNTTAELDAGAVVFFARGEGPDPWLYKSNDPWQNKAVFGPREINLDWYSTWEGHDRVVVMSMDKARATKVPLAK
jgi:4-amino-4-deoxy-L-arabinose transferase-like glycosyltransferase